MRPSPSPDVNVHFNRRVRRRDSAMIESGVINLIDLSLRENGEERADEIVEEE